MSVVIGYVSDYFSIVMTDTRITYGKDAEMGWNDNVEKLVSIPNMGWATGVGVFDFIHNFNRKLAKLNNTTVRIIEELFEKTLEHEKSNNEYLKAQYDSTSLPVPGWARKKRKESFV
jgi:hypothetical protein